MPDRDEHYSRCPHCGRDHDAKHRHGRDWAIFECPEARQSYEHTTASGREHNHARGQPSDGNPTIGRIKNAKLSIPDAGRGDRSLPGTGWTYNGEYFSVLRRQREEREAQMASVEGAHAGSA